MILGYDWPRAHAALNDFPAALLLVSVLFDLLGAFNKRDSLKAAGFWTLIAGVIGTGAAALTGDFASDVVEHSDEAHELMETHQTLGITVLVLFALLALWRLWRRGVLRQREQPVFLTAGVIGVALMVYTARLGGSLMFDHALGIPMSRMHVIEEQRRSEQHHHEGGEEAEEHEHQGQEHPPGSDTAKAAPAPPRADTAKARPHAH